MDTRYKCITIMKKYTERFQNLILGISFLLAVIIILIVIVNHNLNN